MLNPFDSCLKLAQDRLRLRDIFRLRLPACKLVTLSACETALIDFSDTSDEYVGLPSGFLFAGSSHVVSSLWSVFNASTTYVMVKFYKILRSNKGISIPKALWQAQQWYRKNGTDQNVVSLVGEDAVNALQPTEKTRPALGSIRPTYSHSHPVFWAPFVCIG